MIPILFEYNATDSSTATHLPNTHGLGDLVDAMECKAKVTSEGEYELSFSYPCTGELFPELQIGRKILAKVNDYDNPQVFRIYGTESEINGTVTVNCQHISYDLSSYPVKIFEDQLSPSQIVSQVQANVISPSGSGAFPFTLIGYGIPAFSRNAIHRRGEYAIQGGYTWQCIEDITTVPADFNANQWTVLERFTVDTPRSVREILLDGDNSVLGFYGGDAVFDNYRVDIMQSAGQDRGTVIEYGVDLMDLNQDKNISEMVTGVFPYWKGSIRGNRGAVATTKYEVYTGDRFETGYTYYTRTPNYAAAITAGRHYDFTTAYYVLKNGVYTGVALSDLDFKEGLTYYEGVDFSYIRATDISPKPNERYYIPEGNGYREYRTSDLDFRSETVYYERSGNDYVQTQDAHYDWNKTYYLATTIDENTIYSVVSAYDLQFITGLAVYQRTASGYQRTNDTHYQENKTYYLATTNLGSFIPVTYSDLDFREGTTYYVEFGYNYTIATSYQSGVVYYVSDTTEDTDMIVYGDIQYADGFENMPDSAQKIEYLDLSEFFEAEMESQLPTKDMLNKKAKQWMLANDVGIPAIDLTVSYATLGQDVRLFDAVTVRFPKIGIDVKAKVTGYTYDVLNERCTEIEVTNAKASSSWGTLEDASRLRKGLLPPNRIGKKSISGSQIGTGAIDSSNIASGGVKSENIDAEAVTETKIKDKAITYSKIEDGAVQTVHIKDGAVTGTKVLDQAISLKKLDKDLQIFYSDVISALDVFADRATINRYVQSSGYIGDIYFINIGGRQYSMSLHTHSFHEENGYIHMDQGVDWTGGDHSFRIASTRAYKAGVEARIPSSVSYYVNETSGAVDWGRAVVYPTKDNPNDGLDDGPWNLPLLYNGKTAYEHGRESVRLYVPDTITEPGTYTPRAGYDGFSSVTVDVPADDDGSFDDGVKSVTLVGLSLKTGTTTTHDILSGHHYAIGTIVGELASTDPSYSDIWSKTVDMPNTRVLADAVYNDGWDAGLAAAMIRENPSPGIVVGAPDQNLKSTVYISAYTTGTKADGTTYVSGVQRFNVDEIDVSHIYEAGVAAGGSEQSVTRITATGVDGTNGYATSTSGTVLAYQDFTLAALHDSTTLKTAEPRITINATNIWNDAAATAYIEPTELTLSELGSNITSRTVSGKTTYTAPVTIYGYARGLKSDGSSVRSAAQYSNETTADVTNVYNAVNFAAVTQVGINTTYDELRTLQNASVQYDGEYLNSWIRYRLNNDKAITVKFQTPISKVPKRNATLVGLNNADYREKNTDNLSYPHYNIYTRVTYDDGDLSAVLSDPLVLNVSRPWNDGYTSGTDDAKPTGVARRAAAGSDSPAAMNWNGTTLTIPVRASAKESAYAYDGNFVLSAEELTEAGLWEGTAKIPVSAALYQNAYSSPTGVKLNTTTGEPDWTTPPQYNFKIKAAYDDGTTSDALYGSNGKPLQIAAGVPYREGYAKGIELARPNGIARLAADGSDSLQPISWNSSTSILTVPARASTGNSVYALNGSVTVTGSELAAAGIETGGVNVTGISVGTIPSGDNVAFSKYNMKVAAVVPLTVMIDGVADHTYDYPKTISIDATKPWNEGAKTAKATGITWGLWDETVGVRPVTVGSTTRYVAEMSYMRATAAGVNASGANVAGTPYEISNTRIDVSYIYAKGQESVSVTPSMDITGVTLTQLPWPTTDKTNVVNDCYYSAEGNTLSGYFRIDIDGVEGLYYNEFVRLDVSSVLQNMPAPAAGKNPQPAVVKIEKTEGSRIQPFLNDEMSAAWPRVLPFDDEWYVRIWETVTFSYLDVAGVRRQWTSNNFIDISQEDFLTALGRNPAIASINEIVQDGSRAVTENDGVFSIPINVTYTSFSGSSTEMFFVDVDKSKIDPFYANVEVSDVFINAITSTNTITKYYDYDNLEDRFRISVLVNQSVNGESQFVPAEVTVGKRWLDPFYEIDLSAVTIGDIAYDYSRSMVVEPLDSSTSALAFKFPVLVNYSVGNASASVPKIVPVAKSMLDSWYGSSNETPTGVAVGTDAYGTPFNIAWNSSDSTIGTVPVRVTTTSHTEAASSPYYFTLTVKDSTHVKVSVTGGEQASVTSSDTMPIIHLDDATKYLEYGRTVLAEANANLSDGSTTRFQVTVDTTKAYNSGAASMTVGTPTMTYTGNVGSSSYYYLYIPQGGTNIRYQVRIVNSTHEATVFQ